MPSPEHVGARSGRVVVALDSLSQRTMPKSVGAFLVQLGKLLDVLASAGFEDTFASAALSHLRGSSDKPGSMYGVGLHRGRRSCSRYSVAISLISGRVGNEVEQVCRVDAPWPRICFLHSRSLFL